MVENWPTKQYQVIYADPPWSYYNDMTVDRSPNKTGAGSMTHPSYPVMSSKDIKALPVADIAEKDSILFMWSTDYHLSLAMDVITSWGFEYKTIGFAWQKLNKKNQPVCFMGAYTLKSGIELCLLGTRGKNANKMVKNHKVRSLISSIREQHSKKPDEVRDRIVELVGNVPRIELFARQKFEGWDYWGNEV
jgi:N6-adenosine-specific RNA methylase IME4